MTRDDRAVLDWFIAEATAGLRVNRRAGVSAALKKPLLLLLVISRFEQHRQRGARFSFSELEGELAELISRYGGRVGQARPNQPYQYLDGQCGWTVKIPDGPVGHDRDLPMGVLRSPGTWAELRADVATLLGTRAAARVEAANAILAHWWPDTRHSEILQALGLPESASAAPRNSEFPKLVLRNWREECAFCGFAASLDGRAFGLDAAHIRWHSFDGSDESDNGLALCKLHHWAFDAGALTVSGDLRIQVSPVVVGREVGAIQALESLRDRSLPIPRDTAPADEHLEWHRANVFLGD
ncbi:phosphorothioated DNA-binding restriction endonuclease [Nannocystaceae bacterium ST9]